MISFKHRGSFRRMEKLLTVAPKSTMYIKILEKYGRQGVSALREATPKDTGETSDSWKYEIKRTSFGLSLTWTNSNVKEGVPIAVILQYGHGTRSGGYVPGRDYINPAIRPIFDAIAKESWREVTAL